MWTIITGWIRKYWIWIVGILALIIIGAVTGWRLAGILGAGGIVGGAASQYGRQLEKERKKLEERARTTDQMIDDYYKRKESRK